MSRNIGFDVGGWRVEPELNHIRNGPDIVHVRPQVIELLCFLNARRGQVVSTTTILDELWPDTVVTSASIYGCVSELRDRLSDCDGLNISIETVPRRGYRLLGPDIDGDTVQAPARGTTARPKTITVAVIIGLMAAAISILIVINYVLDDKPKDRSLAAVGILSKSVAVLPFENLSPDPDNAYFAAGIHESTISQLARIRDISVIARTSVMQYEANPPPIPEIAEALNVEMVVEGSVRFAEDRVLITVQLIDGRSGTHVWSEQYERALVDIFAIQAEIAERIAVALEVQLTPNERLGLERPATENTEALSMYLRALGGGLPSAVRRQYLTQAIELDPEFALAHARLAHFYSIDIQDDTAVPIEGVAELANLVRQHAEAALRHDPNLGYAYVALARMHYSFWRADDAAAALAQGIELSPNDSAVVKAYARFNSRLGNHPEAYKFAVRAAQLDPNSASVQTALGDAAFFLRDFDAAASAYTTAVDLEPTHIFPHLQLGVVEAMRGNNAKALAEFQAIEQLGDMIPAVIARLAYGYRCLNRVDDAKRLLSLLEQVADAGHRVGPAQFGLAYLAAGNEQQALEWFGKAASSRDPFAGFFILVQVKENTLSDPVIDKAEFREVRGKLGILGD